jgi:hypothetical protein
MEPATPALIPECRRSTRASSKLDEIHVAPVLCHGWPDVVWDAGAAMQTCPEVIACETATPRKREIG